MALLCDVKLSSGLSIENAYVRIENFQGEGYNLSFSSRTYIDEKAYLDKKTPVASESHNFEFDKNSNLYNQMYSYLKTLPEYKYAKEA